MEFGALSLTISNSVGVFNNFLPKLTDVRRGDPNDPNHRGDIRLGELAATAMIIGTGIITSTITGNQMPLIVSVVMALFLCAIYEYALQEKVIS